MDLDAEMERLRKEARAKLDAERGQEDAAAAEHREDVGHAEVAAEREPQEEARRLAARPGAGMSMGGKIATVLAGLVAAWLALVFVVAPLLKIAFVVGIIAVVVWVIIKLMDDDEADETKAP